MPITNKKTWTAWEKANDDPYGKACVDVARQVMKILDDNPGDFDTHKIVCQADKEVKAGGITGFMAGCVAQMVSKCHSRGEEFRRKWNNDNSIQDGGGEKANKKKGAVINPALITISKRK